MTQHIYYGDWKIEWSKVDPVGFDFWIGKEIVIPSNSKIEVFAMKVGFFRDLNKGLLSCHQLIDLCVEQQRRTIIELVEKYSRRRHEQHITISKILGMNEITENP
jgi:hypothetical protein